MRRCHIQRASLHQHILWQTEKPESHNARICSENLPLSDLGPVMTLNHSLRPDPGEVLGCQGDCNP